MSTQRREIAVQALKELWQELKFEGNPLIFVSPMQKRIQLRTPSYVARSTSSKWQTAKKGSFRTTQKLGIS